MRRSSSSPRWGRFSAVVASTRSRLRELALDGREDGLAVRVAALVVADLAQLGGRERVELSRDLRGRQTVVVGDRERRRATDESRRALGAIDLAQHALARGAARAAQELLEVGEHGLDLAAAGREERLVELLGVAAGDAPAPDRVVE